MSEVITQTQLRQLVDRWIADNKRVAGPQRVATADATAAKPLIQYDWLRSAELLLLDGDCPNFCVSKNGTVPFDAAQIETGSLDRFVRPSNSIKELVFPRSEKLYGYKFQGRQIELFPLETPGQEQIVVGARPCDAASLPILDHVFNWDCNDDFYNRRRELTTVVTIACRDHDAHCFCTSVGSSPSDTRGSDVVLLAIDGDRYEVRCLTDKGHRLFNGQTTASKEQGQASQGPPEHFDLAAVGEFLDAGYEQPQWQMLALRCLGCGACAYTCPTCHCFDIVDESTSGGGVRVRNWDACQFSMFTAHASGHNPRNVQAQRQRQRIHHKFQIYPDKFGDLLCTGCGNCTRNCPVNLGVLSVLKAIATKNPTNE